MTVLDGVALAGAGVLAGLVSTVVSLASLVSYPALLAVGLPPLAANVTNTVALVFTGLGAAAGSRPELTGQAAVLRRLSVVTAAGGATGAAVLLLTPPGAFEAVAPWLVGGASLVLLASPGLRRRADQPSAGRAPGSPSRRLLAGAYLVSIYTGYFGAAGGVLMLAVLGTLLPQPLARTNAVKNVVAGAANGVAALGFALFAPVRWSAAAPLAAGFLVGGWLGPAVVRRIDGPAFGYLVAICGLAVAVKLGVDTYR